MGVGYQKGSGEGSHETGTKVGGRRGGRELEIVESRVGAMLLQNVGERTKPRTAFDDNRSILPMGICWFEEVAGAIGFERTTTSAEADKAEGSRLIFWMECNTRMFPPAIVRS